MIAVLGAVVVLHGLVSLPGATEYLQQAPPETLPVSLVTVELFAGALLVLDGVAMARWNGDAE